MPSWVIPMSRRKPVWYGSAAFAAAAPNCVRRPSQRSGAQPTSTPPVGPDALLATAYTKRDAACEGCVAGVGRSVLKLKLTRYSGSFSRALKKPTIGSRKPAVLPTVVVSSYDSRRVTSATSDGVRPLVLARSDRVAMFTFRSALLSMMRTATNCRVLRSLELGAANQNESVQPSPSASAKVRPIRFREVGTYAPPVRTCLNSSEGSPKAPNCKKLGSASSRRAGKLTPAALTPLMICACGGTVLKLVTPMLNQSFTRVCHAALSSRR